MLSFDLATIGCDLIMVINRFTTFIAFRYIFTSVSITLSLMIQIDFFDFINQDDISLKTQVSSSIFKILVITILFTYQGYIIWFIINTFMYFQIVEMEKTDQYNKRLEAIGKG